MVTAIIIDDEYQARNTLKTLIALQGNEVQVIGEADNAEEGVKLLKAKSADVLFLDINLGQRTGFDILNELRTQDFHLVFTTAYDQFALKAFKYHAIDYLLKPIDPDELSKVLARVKLVKSKYQKTQIAEMLKALKQKELTKITISTQEGLFFLALKDIIRLESFRNYTTFFMEDGEKITLTKTIKEFEQLLPTEQFFRVHQSHIVNLSFIHRISRTDGTFLSIKGAPEIPISRRKKNALIELMNKQSITFS